MAAPKPLSKAQRTVLAAAFVPMLATGVAGGTGTFSNISRAYGDGTAVGAVAAGEGATAVLALVLLGLTMLGQSSPLVVRAGLWALPAAASVMSAMAADEPGRTVIYAVTPMGMCVSAEGMAFLARRIVVHTDGRDADADRKAATVVQALAYHRARAANHPDKKVRKRSDRKSWRLARKAGVGDVSLGTRLLDVQRDRVTDGADTALADMFSVTRPVTGPDASDESKAVAPVVRPELESAASSRDTAVTQVSATETAPVTPSETPVTPSSVTPVTADDDEDTDGTDTAGLEDEPSSGEAAVTLEEIASVAGVSVPVPGERLADKQLDAVLRHLRYSADPPLSYRQAVTAFRNAGYVGGEERVRKAWGQLMSHEETNTITDAAEAGQSEGDGEQDEEAGSRP
ncbi:hypothetical protein [Streptomyces chattanoogensis]|uniref:hypothetical protein n=1 Tax=Streptomyces chattanoogensis TaxID=66876 RepID=UPI0036CAF5B6